MKYSIVCPWCEKETEILEMAIENTRRYGSGWHNFSCNHCNKTIKMFFSRKVHWDTESIRRSNQSPDW